MLRFNAKGKSRRTWEVITGDETWIYYYDPRTNAQDRVWLAKDEQAPTKVRRERSTKKLMFSFFFTKRGHLSYTIVPRGKTVNSYFYRRRWFVHSRRAGKFGQNSAFQACVCTTTTRQRTLQSRLCSFCSGNASSWCATHLIRQIWRRATSGCSRSRRNRYVVANFRTITMSSRRSKNRFGD